MPTENAETPGRRGYRATTLLFVMLALVIGLGSDAAAAPGANGKLAYHSNSNIETLNPDGTGRIVLGTGQSAAWSPDGKKLAFSRGGNIFVANADGSNEVQLTTDANWEDYPTWSPEGTHLAYMRGGSNNEVYVMKADGSGQHNVTNNASHDGAPAWSPDGSRIAFHSNRGINSYDIYLMDVDGTDVVQVTNNTDWDWMPKWSPDGKKIVFNRGRESVNQDVFVINADGTGQANLTNNSAIEFGGTWSPDGTRIAFIRIFAQSSDERLMLMNPDGTNVTQLTSGSVARNPDWQTLPVPGPDKAVCDRRFGRMRAYWSFDSEVAPIADSYGHATGINHGATWTAAGKAGGALQFDGINDYVDLRQYFALTNWPAYSVSLWFLNDHGGQWGHAGDGQNLLGKNAAWRGLALQVETQTGSAGQLALHALTDVPTNESVSLSDTTRNFGDNAWHHVVVTRNSTHAELWVDGALKSSLDNMKAADTIDLPLYLGFSPSADPAAQTYWSGKIDEVALFDRALGSAEIRALYSNGVNSVGACGAPAELKLLDPAPAVLPSPAAAVYQEELKEMVLVVGGRDAAGNATSKVYLFDTTYQRWEQVGDLNAIRQSPALAPVTIGPTDTVMVIGGGDNAGLALASTEIYAPNLKTFVPGPDLPEATIIREVQQYRTAAANYEHLLVAGGSNGIWTLSGVYSYDPNTANWQRMADTKYRMELSATVSRMTREGQEVIYIGGRALSMVGRSQKNVPVKEGHRFILESGLEMVELAVVQIYHPETDTWTETGSLNVPRWNHASALLPDGRILVVGGMSGNAPTATVEMYDPTTELWTLIDPLSAPLGAPTATLMPDGTVLVIGEYNGESVMEVFYPAINAWGETSTLEEGRAGHSATLLSTGEVLILGGEVEGTPSAEADLYQLPQVSFITVVNATDPEDASQAFDFTSDIPEAATFSLDGGADDDEIIVQQSFGPLQAGNYTITQLHENHYSPVVVCDTGETGTTSVTIDLPVGVGVTCTFSNTMHAPVATDLSAATAEQAPVPVTLAATDADGDTLTYSIVITPQHGLLSGTPPHVTYTPEAGYTGSDSFTYLASDGIADSNEATVTVDISSHFVYVTSQGGATPIAYLKGDILRYNGTTWTKWYSSRASGLPPTADLIAFDVDTDAAGTAYLVYYQTLTRVPGVGRVLPQDVVHYNGTDFSLFFDGSDVGLTLPGERIDGLEVRPGMNGCDNFLLITTMAGGTVRNGLDPLIRFTGDDVLGFCMSSSGETTSGVWTLVFDGAAEGLRPNNSIGLSANTDLSRLYILPVRAFSADGATIAPTEIAAFDTTSRLFSGPVWKAKEFGIPQAIDDFDVVGMLP